MIKFHRPIEIFLDFGVLFAQEQKSMKKISWLDYVICIIALVSLIIVYCQSACIVKNMIGSNQASQVQTCFKIRTQTSFPKRQGLYENQLPRLARRRNWEAKLSNHSKLYRDERYNQNYFQVGEEKPSNNFACFGQLDCQNHLQDPRYVLRVNPLNQVQNQKTIAYLAVDSRERDPNYMGEKLMNGDIFRLATAYFAVVDIVNTQFVVQSSSFPKEVGKIYQVKKIKQEGKKIPSDQLPSKHKKIKKQPKKHQKIKNIKEEQPMSCRVCHSQEETEIDPLISPCKCTGSCKVIHLQCLKIWVASKNKVRHEGQIQWHYVKISSCEICKEPFPRAFDLGDKVVDLITINTRKSHYMVIQQYANESIMEEAIIYIVLSALPGFINRIGRSSQNNIIMPITAASRRHAQIQYVGGYFYLRDCESQFGTVIKLKRDLEFPSDRSLKIRVGTCFYEVMPMMSNQPLNGYRNSHIEGNDVNPVDQKDEEENNEEQQDSP